MSHFSKAGDSEVICLKRPFSSFKFIESRFSESPPIRNLFSISRCRGGETLLFERVSAENNVAQENEDLMALDPGFEALDLCRISFWSVSLDSNSLQGLKDDDCIGYALLKKDRLPKTGREGWHVYEAVLRPYPHANNYVNAFARFEFMAAGQKIAIEGCLYAQQNGVSKTCAQVAIRSLAATYFGKNDLSYRTINSLASAGDPAFDPSAGLTHLQISNVLTGLGIEHVSVDYDMIERKAKAAGLVSQIRDDLPYQKLLYSGIESGCGTLMAFSLSGPKAPDLVGHMIPFFGHTFNEDSWVPNAEQAYFKIGEHIAYVPSRSWLTTFLAHDDNFGANLSVPQSFIQKEHVSCVFELLPPGWSYSGVEAEFAAADYFYSILPNAPDDSDLPWLRRLHEYVAKQRLILRHVPISKDDYLNELGKRKDWEMHSESESALKEFRARLTGDKFWMVEVSIPEVFPTNKRKLGEILLDASRDLSPETDGSSFVLARLPGYFVFFDSLDSNGVPSFTFTPNSLHSHTRLYSVGARNAL